MAVFWLAFCVAENSKRSFLTEEESVPVTRAVAPFAISNFGAEMSPKTRSLAVTPMPSRTESGFLKVSGVDRTSESMVSVEFVPSTGEKI